MVYRQQDAGLMRVCLFVAGLFDMTLLGSRPSRKGWLPYLFTDLSGMDNDVEAPARG